MKKILQYSAFLAIGLGLMYFAYKDVKFDDIKESLSHAHWEWIIIALVLNYSATAYRGIRWNTLLEPLGHKADTWTCIHSVTFGYLMNDLIPRSGEVARCTLLNRAEKISIDKLIGTVILERVVDVLMLGIMISAAVILKNEELQVLLQQADGNKGTLLIYLAIAGVIGLIVFFYALKKLQHISFVAKIAGFVKGITDGMKTILSLRRKGAFIFWTLAIWGTWLVMTQCMMFSLEETQHLDMGDSLFLMVSASLGMIVPTQGGIGAYHYMTMLAFMALGMANADDPHTSTIGLTFAAISWTGKTVLELIMGVISFFAVTEFKMKRKAA